jgi:uncharacterized GH25 family protein
VKYLFVAAALMLPAAVFAHGVDISDVSGQQDVRTIRFSYTDGTPMLFAKVKVFPPSSPDAPAQESIADRNGYFSFVNDEPGEWRLTAEDGMGHKGEIMVAVAGEMETAAGAQNTAPGDKLPPPVAAVLGLSLIANVFGLWYFGKKKFPKREAAHAH